MKRLKMFFGLLALSLMLVMPAVAADYDLVINNGRVMDPETLYDDITNVGIKDGRIVAITKDQIKGKQTINADGLVVAPGFIDTHFHSVDPFATKLVVADGVTTGMDLEAGTSNVGEWYGRKDKSGWQINYGSTVAMGIARLAVHDPEIKINEPVDASNMSKYLDEAAKDGVPG
jgi:N-acyl-D-aspartate/D-glutamate deacylase